MERFPRVIESGGVVLTLTPNEVYIEFQERMPREAIEEFITKYKLRLVKEETGFLPSPNFNEVFSDRRWLRLPEEDIERFIKQTLQDERVRLASPVYHRADMLPKKTGLTFSDFLLVRFRDDIADREIDAYIKELGAEDASGKPNLLGDALRRIRIRDSKRSNALEESDRWARVRIVKHAGPDWMQLNSLWSATIPNDTYFANQWNLSQIGAPDGWDITTGSEEVVIAIIDSGCDLHHEDLLDKYVPVEDRYDAVAGTNTPDDQLGHGTCCAGIAAAVSNNAQGVAGVAWNCRIMPISIYGASESHLVNALNWARTHGAHVISMSWHWDGSRSNADTAIADAHAASIVLVAATGNSDNASISYPASHPSVIAVGASDWNDQRKRPASSDGECWGSQWGTQLSVMAPGVQCWSTDPQGTNGFNNNNGGAMYWACVDYPSCGSTDGSYFSLMDGTSAATPHVAGLAALLRSQYSALTNDQIRSIIEKTAEKVGGYVYADDSAHPNGTWNNEMGYGRINVFHALDFADVMIKDIPTDTGLEPSTTGDYWNFSDIVVRINDDGTFNPSNPSQSKNVERGQANYIYVRVTNNGPNEARNVTVSTRITPWIGLQFVYPQDWTLEDDMHVSPASITANFASIPSGGTVMAKFRIEADQTETLYGWQTDHPWHPCLLAQVNADNDYAFASASLTGNHISARRNNLAQRNLSVIDVLSNASLSFPFVAGSLYNAESVMSITIDRSRLPKTMPLLLALDDDGSAFPLVNFETQSAGQDDCCYNSLLLLDRTRIKTRLGCCTGILTLEKGSRFDCCCSKTQNKPGKVTVKGGELIVRGDKRYVEVKESKVTVQMEKAPNSIYPLFLQTTIPATAKRGEQFFINVAQQNVQGVTAGGAGVVYVVK